MAIKTMVCKLPKLKLKKHFGYPFEEIRNLEEAQYFLFGYGATAVVVIDNRVINSYEELIKLVTQDCYKDKEFLEVWLLPPLVGGG